MPDFDSFERIFKSAVAGDMSIALAAQLISTLPTENQVAIVKGKGEQEVANFLVRGQDALLSFFEHKPQFSSSDNNRQGKDLFDEVSGTQIELKSGRLMTDANSGLSTISWAISDDAAMISQIMKSGMIRRRELLLTGADVSEIERSKSETMDRLASFLDSQIGLGKAPPRLDHFLRCVSMGLTKSVEVKASFQTGKEVKRPLLLEADWQSGLVLYKKAFLPDEEIIVTRIERTHDRAQVIAQGSISSNTARIYPNYKNSWKMPNGIRAAASNWVETPCFHVWIG